MAEHRFFNKESYDQVSGLFTSYTDFSNLIESLNTRGYHEEDISVLMSEQTHRQYFSPQENTKAPEGASIGGLSGGIIGAIIGGLTVIGSVAIPGGLLVAGPLVGALTAGALGAATGGLIGGLIGAGIPEHEAKFFEDALKNKGQILVVAHVPKDETKEAKAIFERNNATHLKVHSGAR